MEIQNKDFNPIPTDFVRRFKKNLDRIKVERKKPTDEKSFVDRLRKRLEGLMSDMKDPPKLTVAVYGDTGSGKSSLLNAILDQPNLVPTAGMGEACTSVAIRIEENNKKGQGEEFSAEIEFLSKEEWARELKVLTKDLTDTDMEYGGSESATTESARAMIEAVYGEFDESNSWEMINTENEVTARLGTTLVVKEKDARVLQDELLKYIDSSWEEEGGQYWPILKEVTIKLPKSERCTNRTVLIDLPGVGDSNPARDGVAKKYVRSCDVMLVVAKIPRAVDNITAETMLGERMMYKVKMGGRRTVMVCTQADLITPQEVIRKLKLPEAAKWTAESQKLTEEEMALQKRLKQLKREKDKTPALFEEEANIYRDLEVVKGMREQLVKEKTSRCAVERSNYVKRNMMTKDKGSSEAVQALMEVFCVSSKDYHKLAGCLEDDDDQPPVFMTTEQTEIPKLRECLAEASEEKREVRRENIKRKFRSMVSGLYRYLTNIELGRQIKLQNAVEKNLQTFERQTGEVVGQVDEDIQKLLQDLYVVLNEGVKRAEENAPTVCAGWSKPVNKSRRTSVDLPCSTYKATVSRDGEYYTSTTGIPINMNEDLCDPLFRSIVTVWAKVFNEHTWKISITDKIRTRFSQLMDAHSKEVLASVRALSHDATALSTNIDQLRRDAEDKLHSLNNIGFMIQYRTSSISASIPDIIKEEMKPTYSACQEKTGPGSFQDIKMTMAIMIERQKTSMFKNLKDDIVTALADIKRDVISEVTDILTTICEDHRKQMEPLWQDQGGVDFFPHVRQCRDELAALTDDVEKLEQDKGRKRKGDSRDGDGDGDGDGAGELLNSPNKAIKI